jgi:hypothetical protein
MFIKYKVYKVCKVIKFVKLLEVPAGRFFFVGCSAVGRGGALFFFEMRAGWFF